MDRGWRAWSVVVGSVLIQTFAFAPTEFIFGVFEQEYLLKFPGASPPSIALIGTIGTSTTYLVGFLSGMLSDRWGLVVCGGASMLMFERDKQARLLRQLQLDARNKVGSATSFRIPEFTKGLAFALLVALRFFLSMAYLTPIYFMELYGTYIGLSKQTGAAINGWFNGASFAARILSGLLADLVATDVVLLICIWVNTLSILILWTFSHGFPVFLTFAIVYGMSFSGTSTVTPVMVANYYGPEQLTSVLGIVYGCSCIALLSGSLISGHLLDMNTPHPKYLPVIMYSGGMFGASALCATAWVGLMRRKKNRVIDLQSK
ncbi:hypothetical protein BGZ82_004253 [Podila clonocystis]|nr:hypothetical protein BGZ82_004253 [Podila clonocystis]